MYDELHSSARQGMLLLIDGGMCRFGHKRSGEVTIYEIISLKPGTGTVLLDRLLQRDNVASIVAKCPVDLPSNAWYERKGFELVDVLTTRTQRQLNVWRLWCKPDARYATPTLFDTQAQGDT